ncbi:MAG: undecaprenyl/decaprenyl-phosphate alpha-N-acetylglucosaminyl 1-phosphate transferase [Bacteroidales bacterium]|nr:undecaprenyl/decaprenyl-phosphate alpha-N-acetylglucosaminyl 1-phosphate transferase [Bacteroidales bacterium]
MKHLYDVPEERKSHNTVVPTLGGLGIFIGFILSVTFWTDFAVFPGLQYLEFALIVIFFLGIKDDIIALAPGKKALGILLAAGVIAIWGDIRISGFYGMFGIHELPYWLSILFTIFTVFIIINAVNLIDGINGLCSSTSIISALSFGTWFYLEGSPKSFQLAIICAAIVGSVLAFLRYNVTPAKIFMGDTGSLLLGLLLAFLAIEFLEINWSTTKNIYYMRSSPVVAMGFLALPLVDMVKVFAIRLYRKRSPFHPDKNHIHHILLSLGFTHTNATILLSLFSIFFVLLSLYFNNIGSLELGLIIFPFALLISVIPNIILYTKNKKKYEMLEKESAF